MTFLPIVERELRVASRRKFTYWGRLAAAGFALLIFGGLQSLGIASRGTFSGGVIEFTVLKWMTFVFACAAGVFLTSDSLSEEKREGTLGLLFLTDLRGYDIVFGKLMSQSLRAFYGLLAAFPILGLTMLLGGVTGAEFDRVVLVICNTLFFSLAVGLFVSSISRDPTKAMNAALLLNLLVLAVLPLADWFLSHGPAGGPFKVVLSIASPGYLFAHTGGYLQGDYWLCLGVQHGLAWVLLVSASICAPRTWQEKAAAGGSRSGFFHRWRFGGPRVRAAIRRRFMDPNPVRWLSLRDRWLPRLVIALAGLLVLIEGTNFVVRLNEYQSHVQTLSRIPVLRFLAGAFQSLVGFLLVLWLAAQSSRFFVDAVRNGALEILLTTPVIPRTIVQAQWSALCRTYLVPALCIVLLQTGGGILSVLEMNRSMTTRTVPVPVVTRKNGVATTNFMMTNTTVTTTVGASGVTVSMSSAALSMRRDFTTYQIVTVVLGAFTLLAGLAAVAWFGMWMGLTNRKISVAVLKTVCFVYVLPWIAFGFIYGFTMVLISYSIGLSGGGGSPFTGMIAASVVGAFFNLAKDAFFIVWSRRRLLERFRATVAQEGKPLRRAFPPAPPPLPSPPVLGAPAA